ncbi:hypothetical protein D3C87_1716150 [compost metagenome]
MAFTPPKPNPLSMACVSAMRRGCSATMSRPWAKASGSCRFKVPGTTWSRNASAVKMAATAPAAPSKCPVADLVELMATSPAVPNTRRMAASSPRSPTIVDVACAFRCCTCCAVRPACASAASMLRAAPSPSSGPEVMWYASADVP